MVNGWASKPCILRVRRKTGTPSNSTTRLPENYTPGAIRLRMEQVDGSIARYLGMLDTADRQEDRVAEMRVTRLSERLEALCRRLPCAVKDSCEEGT